MLKLFFQLSLLTVTALTQFLPNKMLTMDNNDPFKIAVFSDLLIDTDGSNYAFTMQLIQNVIDSEMKQNSTDSDVDLVVLMGNTVDPDFEDQYQQRFEEAVAYFKIRGIPWVSVGGVDRESNFGREQKIIFDKIAGATLDASNYSLSLTVNSTTYT